MICKVTNHQQIHERREGAVYIEGRDDKIKKTQSYQSYVMKLTISLLLGHGMGTL